MALAALRFSSRAGSPDPGSVLRLCSSSTWIRAAFPGTCFLDRSCSPVTHRLTETPLPTFPPTPARPHPSHPRTFSTLPPHAPPAAVSRPLAPSFSLPQARLHSTLTPLIHGSGIRSTQTRRSEGGGEQQGDRSGSSAAFASALAAAGAAAASSSSASAKQVPLGGLPEDVVLYQYEACPFCNKVKAYLDYYDIPYRVVEVNPLTRKEIKWSEYKKVPILVVDGEPYQDSSAIITRLQQRLNPEDVNMSEEREEKVEEQDKWRRWVDQHLVHLLSPNIYRNPSEALEAFDYIATNGKFGVIERTLARYVGASTMYMIGKRLKKKHNITDERESLYSALNDWVSALGTRKFLGGEKPNLADLAVFGVLRPIRSMQTGRDMLEHTKIGRWYTDMEAEVGASARLPAEA